MKRIIALSAALLLAGCLTTAQDAQLACLGTATAAQIAKTNAQPLTAAQVQANGQILCTFVTGAAVIVSPPAQ